MDDVVLVRRLSKTNSEMRQRFFLPEQLLLKAITLLRSQMNTLRIWT